MSNQMSAALEKKHRYSAVKVICLLLLAGISPVGHASEASPTTFGLAVGGRTTITICFPVCITSAEFSDYTVNGGAATINPPATLLADSQTVLLDVSNVGGSTYTLDIADGTVATCAGGTLAGLTLTGTIDDRFNIQDIGNPSTPGVAFNCGPGGIGLIAGGNAYAANADQMTFAYESVTGDFDKKAQIARLDAGDPSDALARGGLMARASTNAGAVDLKLLASNPLGDNALRILVRADAGSGYDEVDHAYGGVWNNLPNQWIRMKRAGNSFQMFVGTNGVDWARVGQTWRELPDTVLLGCYAAAGLEGSTATVQFNNYTDVDFGDHTPPALVSAGTIDQQVVGVKFSETINSQTAMAPANYAVRNADNTPATVTAAKVGIDGDSVYLSVTGLSSDTFTVTLIGGITDSAGNVIAASSAAGKVSPWTSEDIGYIQNPAARPTPGDDPYRVGQAVAVSSEADPEMEIIGGGSNLSDNGDYGHFVHRPMTGDFDQMVEITRFDRCYLTGGYANAGLMVRDTLYNLGEAYTQNGTEAPYYANMTYSEDDASGWSALALWRNGPHDSTHDSLGSGREQCCFVLNQSDLIDGINGTFGRLRAADASGAPSVNSSPNGSRWLRIKRVGDHFTSYASYDGAVWSQYEELDHPMNPTVEVGLFTVNDSGANPPPGNAYDNGDQRASQYSVVHVRHFGVTPVLNLAWNGNSATLSWTTGTLQSAPTITGPWTDAANQSNPQDMAPSGAMQFFRLKLN